MSKSLRILYLADVYHKSSGGSTHAREFSNSLKNNHIVEYLEIFPDKETFLNFSLKQSSKYTIINLMFRSYLYFRIYINLLPRLSEVIKSKKINCLILRSGKFTFFIPKIKKLCPNVVIATEVNALLFDEIFKAKIKYLIVNLEAIFLSKSDLIFPVSSYLKTILLKHRIDKNKIFVNHNGVIA